MGATNNRSAIGAEPPKFFGAYNLLQIAGDVRSGTVEFNVCPLGFWACFGSTPLYLPVCNFLNGNVYLY